MNNTQKWYHSTAVIIIAFLFFWPLGIFCLVSRANAGKSGAFIGGIDKKVATIIAVVLGLFAIVSLSDGHFFMFLLYGGGAVAVFMYGKKNSAKIERNKKYVNMIVNNGETSIDIIANNCGVNYEQCRDELQKLIDKGIFQGAVINEGNHSITIQRKLPAQSVSTVTSAAFVDVSCPGCGATISAPKGTVVECEYCGNTFTAS